MSYIEILQGTPTWLPFLAANVGNGDPRTGILFNQITVAYKKSTDAAFISKILTGVGDYRENGNGFYEILFSAPELSVLGTFLYVVNSNGALPSPAMRQAVGQAFIESSSSYTPGTVTLNTNIVTGNLISLRGQPLIGEAVSARIVAAPTIIGSSPNIGGVGTDMVTTKTDSGGFFALELLQNSVVDVVIPVINYRRTLTVPAHSTDVLFNIP